MKYINETKLIEKIDEIQRTIVLNEEKLEDKIVELQQRMQSIEIKSRYLQQSINDTDTNLERIESKPPVTIEDFLKAFAKEQAKGTRLFEEIINLEDNKEMFLKDFSCLYQNTNIIKQDIKRIIAEMKL